MPEANCTELVPWTLFDEAGLVCAGDAEDDNCPILYPANPDKRIDVMNMSKDHDPFDSFMMAAGGELLPWTCCRFDSTSLAFELGTCGFPLEYISVQDIYNFPVDQCDIGVHTAFGNNPEAHVGRNLVQKIFGLNPNYTGCVEPDCSLPLNRPSPTGMV